MRANRGKRSARVLVGLAILFGVLAVGPAPPAAADTSGYPYASMPCIWEPFAVYGTKAQWCADYDWGTRPNDLSFASVLSPYGYYYRNCTDYAAWKVGSLGVEPSQYKGLGDAKSWAVLAPNHGLRVDDVPAVGSVAVRTSGKYGHAAFVEAINPSGFGVGTIKVSQYNYAADGNYSEQYGTPGALGFSAFVHFEDYEAALAALPAIITPASPEPPSLTAPLEEAAPSVEEIVPIPLVINTVQTEPTSIEQVNQAIDPVADELPADSILPESTPQNLSVVGPSELNPLPKESSSVLLSTPTSVADQLPPTASVISSAVILASAWSKPPPQSSLNHPTLSSIGHLIVWPGSPHQKSTITIARSADTLSLIPGYWSLVSLAIIVIAKGVSAYSFKKMRAGAT